MYLELTGGIMQAVRNSQKFEDCKGSQLGLKYNEAWTAKSFALPARDTVL